MDVVAECLFCSKVITCASNDYSTFIGHMRSNHNNTEVNI